MNLALRRGDVVWVRLDPTVGCEIQKCRPAIVVTADDRNENVLNRIISIVPLTTIRSERQARGDEVVVEPGVSGLTQRSVTVTDQLRSIDRQRIEGRTGRVSSDVMAQVDRCLETVLALA